MTSHSPKIEVLSGPERRRRWSTAEKLAIIQETYEPDATVSIVARRYGIQPNQLFTWRKLATQGALTATAAEEDVVPASEYRALQNQVKELQRLLGKKTMEGEILKEALHHRDLRYVYLTRVDGHFDTTVRIPNVDALGFTKTDWDGETALEENGVRYRIERLARG